MGIVTIELIAEIKRHYSLYWHGSHGIVHWSRVFDIGMKLSKQEGVIQNVVQLFSIFHDSQRMNEGKDPDHGRRGAHLTIELREHLPINDDEFQLLVIACSLHTSANNHENISVQACFDSDRLDLGRVGIEPNPDLLCTPMAKQEEMIEWAYDRSVNNHELPDNAFRLSDEKGYQYVL